MIAEIIKGRLVIGAECDTEVYALEQYLKGCKRIEVPPNLRTSKAAHTRLVFNITLVDNRFIGLNIKGQNDES